MTKVIHKKLGREAGPGKRHLLGLTMGNKNSSLIIDPRQRHKTYLGTLIHEKLHTLLPDFSERKILKLEKELRDLLWDNHYRQVKQ